MATVLKEVTGKSAYEQSEELKRWKKINEGKDLYIQKKDDKRYIVRR